MLDGTTIRSQLQLELNMLDSKEAALLFFVCFILGLFVHMKMFT